MLAIDGVGKVFPTPSGLQRLFARTASNEPVVALRQVDLHVDRGEIVGLIGPNGAGKTTLLKIIATLLDPTEGRVEIDGLDATADPLAARSRIGLVLTDDRSLYWRLTGRQNLEFFGVMQGLTHREASLRADALMERAGLAHRDKLVYAYSSGMRSQLAIARAMIHRPPLLILDEPTRALDPIAAAAVGDLLCATARDGVAVLLSSHRVDEIESICDRLLAIVDGEMRFTGTVADLAADRSLATALRELLAVDIEAGARPGGDPS